MTALAKNRQRAPVVLLRPVPGDTVIHRLWAGTKLIAVVGIGVLLTFYPGWVPIGLVAALIFYAAARDRFLKSFKRKRLQSPVSAAANNVSTEAASALHESPWGH